MTLLSESMVFDNHTTSTEKLVKAFMRSFFFIMQDGKSVCLIIFHSRTTLRDIFLITMTLYRNILFYCCMSINVLDARTPFL